MRRALTTAAIVTVLAAFIPTVGRGTPIQSPESGCRSAMAPYYAALLASAHGDADGTLRQLILLRSRWEQLTRQPQAHSCAWLSEVVDGRSVAVSVASQIETARTRLPRDVPAAHADLEAIRLLLRDARARRGLRTFDDALTDYHEAMERLESLIGARNEVSLTARDFDAIRDQARTARTAWADVNARHRQLIVSTAWPAVADRTDSALMSMSEGASAHDAAAAHRAAEIVKSQYFDLLRILSRVD